MINFLSFLLPMGGLLGVRSEPNNIKVTSFKDWHQQVTL
jgi:hypothetical protein